MERYKLIVAYDGTGFSGFQRQASTSGIRTVQSTIESVLKGLGWSQNSILFAGRTDSGVHASGQVISFDLDWQHAAEDLQRAMNANLPQDVSIRSLDRIDSSFHPRYDARSRIYRYHFFFDRVRDPLKEKFAWRLETNVENVKLQEACRELCGSHDFKNFGSPLKPGGSTIREVFRSDFEIKNEDYFYTIEANAFLYHMVRRIVRLLVDIGSNRIEINCIREFLQNKSSGMVHGLAPAKGLNLVGVQY